MAGRRRLAAFLIGLWALSLASCQREASRPGPSSTLPPSTPAHAALVAALESRRLVEPRLTGGFLHAPPGDDRTRFSAQEREALSKAEKAIRKEQSLHALGVLAILLGRTDQAVTLLERAAARDSQKAAVWSDLAAACLIRGTERDRPLDLIAALDAAEKAAELSPASPEALFNRALARERLSLVAEAAQAWQEYRRQDGTSGWSEEAAAALARLQAASDPAESWPAAQRRLLEAAAAGDRKTLESLVVRFPQEARSFGEDEILASWADHYLRGRFPQAETDLGVARSIGAALVRLSGESMLADAVRGIDQASCEPERMRRLADGLTSYRKGFLLIRDRRFGPAEAPLEEARQLLRQASNPFEAWARFLLIRCAYQRSDYAEVQRRARALLQEVDLEKHPVVAARTRWVLGTAQMALARPAEALDSYRFALLQFEKTRETVNQASVHSLIASAFNELGDGQSAWQHRARALRGLAGRRNPERLRITLTNVAFASLDAGSARAALLLQSEAVDIAREQKDPEWLASALLNRAAILEQAGLTGADEDLSAARQHCERIADPSIRQSILADLLAVEGRQLGTRQPARSFDALSRSFAMYEAAGRRVMLPNVLRLRAAALQKLGRISEAELDLRNAIQILEEERGSVPEGEQRAGFIDRTGAVFDAMVRLQTEQGHAELALEYSERRRARLLLDWLSAIPQDLDPRLFQLRTWTHPRPVRELRAGLPDSVAVVAYELLPERLLVWLVRKGSVDQRQVEIPAARIAENVRRLERAVAGPESRLREAGAALQNVLLAPVSDLLQAGETVIFVPESPLFSVPFGLLFDPRAGRYLLEERAFSVAPSLSSLARLAQDASDQDFSRADILAVANPAFDRSLFPLRPLPGAEQEGKELRALFPQARFVSGEAAGREALLEGLGRFRIVHFGGHALANPGKPLLSSLLLAPRPARGDSGVLYARELVGPPGGATRLVVLAACRSGGGEGPPGEGVAGLVWPFFSRGVPMVIASTQDVEDRKSAALFSTFYRHLAAGDPPVAALRKAQLEALAASRHEESPSFDWATFQLHGATGGVSRH